MKIKKAPALCRSRLSSGRWYHYLSAVMYASEEEAKADIPGIYERMAWNFSVECDEPEVKAPAPVPTIKMKTDKRRFGIK